MMLAGKLNIPQAAIYSEEAQNFYGTQIQLMQSAEVKRGAPKRWCARPIPKCSRSRSRSRSRKNRAPRFSNCSAIGSTAEYTQAYLNAVMQKYLDFKKGHARGPGQNVITAITEQLIQVEKDLRNGEDEMLEFQKQNNIGFIQEEGNSAAAYLVQLNQQLRFAENRI